MKKVVHKVIEIKYVSLPGKNYTIITVGDVVLCENIVRAIFDIDVS